MNNTFKGLQIDIELHLLDKSASFTIDEWVERFDGSKRGTTEYIDYSKITHLIISKDDKLFYKCHGSDEMKFFDVTVDVIVTPSLNTYLKDKQTIVIQRGLYKSVKPLTEETTATVTVAPESKFFGKKLIIKGDNSAQREFKITNWLESTSGPDAYPSDLTLLMIANKELYYVCDDGYTSLMYTSVILYVKENTDEGLEYVVSIRHGGLEDIYQKVSDLFEAPKKVQSQGLPGENNLIIDNSRGIPEDILVVMQRFLNEKDKNLSVTACESDSDFVLVNVLIKVRDNFAILGALDVAKQLYINEINEKQTKYEA
jgi:hypothetical protein